VKKRVISKTEEQILKTHPIRSKTEGWFLQILETSNNVFLIEATDLFGRVVSKQGIEPNKLQEEIENIINSDFRKT
jgi:hypothetical protein